MARSSRCQYSSMLAAVWLYWRSELALEGGILGRTDDMVCVRGVNVYPSAVEEIIRSQDGVAEYQVGVDTAATLAQIAIRIEPQPNVPEPYSQKRRQLAG